MRPPMRRACLLTLLVVVGSAWAAPQQSPHSGSTLAGQTDSRAAKRPLKLTSRWPEPWLRRPPWREAAADVPELQVDSAAAARDARRALARTGSSLAQQFLRSSRAAGHTHQPYDVPIIECPPANDGMERFACPTQDRLGRYRCIDDHMLCDGYRHCPGGEDEDRQNCMFYKTTKSHLNVLADALLRWVRGR